MAGTKKITEKQWVEIKQLYEMGVKIRDIAQKFNYTAGNIVRKAKQLGWINGATMQVVQAKADAIKEIIAIDNKLKQSGKTEKEMEIINKKVMDLADLKFQNHVVQCDTIELMKKIVKQSSNIINDNPSGMHIKSQTDSGITYARNSEIVKDLTPILNGINSQLNPATTAVQINNESKSKKVSINIIGVE